MGSGGMSVEPREVESMAVTLTRMEGKLDNVVEKVSDLRAQVAQHGTAITLLQSATQQLQSDRLADETARIAAAAAVRNADEARVAAAKAQVDNSVQQWTPWQRFYATLGALAAIAAIVAVIFAIVT